MLTTVMKILFVCVVVVSVTGTQARWTNTCTDDGDCGEILGSTCKDNECSCDESFLISGDLTACVPAAAGLNQNCTEDRECSWRLGNGAVCSDGTCVCKSGYHYVEGTCRRSRRLGEICTESRDCFDGFDIEATACEAGVCACNRGYYPRSDIDCRKIGSKKGEPCVIDLDCRFNKAYCDDDLLCKKKLIGYGEDDTMTYVRIDVGVTGRNDTSRSIIGSDCSSDDECVAELLDSECFTRRCFCKRGFFYDEVTGRCVYELGVAVEDETKCRIRNGEIRDGKCLCRVGFGYKRTMDGCIKPARGMNHSCLVDENCFTFGPSSVCVDKKCHCAAGMWFDDESTSCRIQKSLGDPCRTDSECYREFAMNETSPECLDDVCGCPDGYHGVAELNACRPDSVPLGELCYDSKECLGEVPYSVCKDNACTCEDKYFDKDSKCVKGIGSDCSDSDDCIAERSTCKDKVCRCVDDLAPIGALCYDRVKNVNDPCTIDAQCHLVLNDPGSECVDGKCTCSVGYHHRNDNCWPLRRLGDVCTNDGQCFVTTVAESVECRNGICQCDYGRVAGDDRESCPSRTEIGVRVSAVCTVLLVLAGRLV